jgi:hypothetical protein
MKDMRRRSFLESLLSLAARGLALLGGTSLLAGCPQPVKYGGPPIEPQPTKYGGPVPPGVYPKYGTPVPASQPSRPPPNVAPEYGIRRQPATQPAPKVKAATTVGGRGPTKSTL